MASLDELTDPTNPKVGAAFIKTLKIPDGMFTIPDVWATDGDPKAWETHPACVRPNVQIPVFDNLFGTAAQRSWKERQDELLDQLFGKDNGPTDTLPSPAEVYYRFWKYPVTGAVMVVQVRSTKFSVSEPFLISVTFPTVLPRGHTGEVFHETSPTARFMPGQGLLPQHGKFPLLCGALQALREFNTMRDVKLQTANLLSDYIVGFGQKTFSHLVAPLASVATGTEKEQLRSLAQTWESIMQEPFGSLPSDTKIRPVLLDGDSATEGIRIPMILPLIGPLQFPPGIIGHTSIGTNGIKQLAGHYMADDSIASDLTWLDHPMVQAWFAAAARFPNHMALEVTCKQSIALSLTYEDENSAASTVSFANPLALDFWRVMEATLAFRYQLDTLIGHPKASNMARSFHKYLNNAAAGLYHKNNILGQRPFEVGFEVLLLRPPVAAGKRGTHTFRDLLSMWSLQSFFCPSFLSDYKVEFVDYTIIQEHPLQRIDNQDDPSFAEAPDFGTAEPTMPLFPADDPRIADPAHDTEVEKYERNILTILDLRPDEDANDDLFPQENAQFDQALRELHELRTRPLKSRGAESGKWAGRSAQRDREKEKRTPGVDPFEFLLQSSSKRQRKSMPADDFTPSRPPTQESGIRPDNVPRQKYHGDELADQLASLRPAAAPLQPSSSSELFDNESDDPQVLEHEAPLQKLRDKFVSPLGETAQTAIVIESGSHEALVARLRRRHPMADKHGELIPSTCHSLLAEDVPVPGSRSGQSSIRAAAPVERWSLSISGQGTPTHFTFWSLILTVHEPHFRGNFEGGSRHGRPVDPDWCLFPAIIGNAVRNQFFGTDHKDLEAWVHSCAGRARRDACFAQSPRMGWLQPGPFLTSLSRDVLHQFRQGLWNCSSYYERDSAPIKTNFNMFSMLTTRANSASNRLPNAGLSYNDCMEVLRNTFFLLSLPVTQGLPNASPELIEAVLDRTVLLSVLRRFLDRLCDDPRSFHTVSLRSYWNEKCDARAKNALAFTILSYVDELLSLLGACVTDPTPALRMAHDSGDNDNIYLLVDPTVRNPAVLQSNRVRNAAQPLIQSALAIWDTAALAQIEQYIRGEPQHIPSAPACYVDPPQKQHPLPKKEEEGKLTTPPRKKKGGRSKAAIPIVQWGPNAPANIRSSTGGLNELLQNNKPHPRFPSAGDSSGSNKLICFAFCLAEHDGCQRGPKCKFAHIDGVAPEQTGPTAFGSLTQYLEKPNIKDVIVYTDTGRRLAGN